MTEIEIYVNSGRKKMITFGENNIITEALIDRDNIF